jgi:N-acetylglucosamine-6-sulfatase
MRSTLLGRACLALAVGLAFIASSPGVEVAGAQEKPGAGPNFVIVMTDDQDVASMRVMNAVRRQLVRSGTRFDNFYSTLPLCCPSRASLLTGQYAHNHGVRINHWRNFDHSQTVPVALQRGGYRTGYVGKYLNGYQRRSSKRPRWKPPGWTSWFGLMTPSRMLNWILNENGRPIRYRGRRNYQTDVLADKAVNFIRASAGRNRPFFLTVATLAPHMENHRSQKGLWPNPRPAPRHSGAYRRAKLPRPPSFNEADVSDKPSFVRLTSRLSKRKRTTLRRVNRSRMASLLAVDDLVKRVMRQLRATGQLKRTYVIFTSDNGFMLGEHRLAGKKWLYDESIKVPMILRGPGVPNGARRQQITGNIDIAPMILEEAGVRPRVVPDGISLLPLARDPGAAKDRALLLDSHRKPESWVGAAVRAPGWFYARQRIRGALEYELYDMAEDPHQLGNLAWRADRTNPDADPDLIAGREELAQRLSQLRGCTGLGCR